MAIIQGEAAREALLGGIDELAAAVGSTLGPKGRNVAMHQKANLHGADYGDRARAGAPVLITNDGVTIAKEISFADPVKNMGAQLMKEAAVKANDEAGDGTTTAIVLAQALLQGAFRNIAAGADPLALRRGVKAAGDLVVERLVASAVPVVTEDDIAHVATISCQDETLGAMVGEAIYRVGLEGVVNIDDSQRVETTLTVDEGIVFDRGLISPHMATDTRSGEAVLEEPYILICDKKFENAQDVIPALICAAEDGRDILVICDGIEGDALALVMRNKLEGEMNVACVQAPAYGEGRRWRLDDIAVQTGGMFVSEEMGLSIRDVTREMLGSCERVKVTRKRTIISGGQGDPEAVERRVAELRYRAENTDYDFNRKRHAERLASFVSGVATIAVGGVTEAEQWERKMRVEDAVNAARAAFEEGVVAGGGVTLLGLVPALEEYASSLEGDERTGVRIAIDACMEPLLRIAGNAGVNGHVVAERLRDATLGMGYDAARARYVDMFEAGIIDPVRVTRSAVEAAFSVAETLLVSEAGVTPVKGEAPSLAEAFHAGGAR
ncbi:MAG: molecular chaperone GroEL [Atopobiaceae bacterium]|nr:molecular chaperone GroEL [Atopobiaceae bacterium]